jgi:hypothetical protein
MSLTMQRLAIGCVCAALAAAGCAGGSVNPVSPSASPARSSLAAAGPGPVGSHVSASFPRSGNLHVTKTCPPSTYTGAAGDFCTITSSNVPEIEVGSRVVYAQAADFSTLSLDSDVVIDLPGPGHNTALGHCQVNLASGIGRCTFSGGTGKFTQFHGSVNGALLGGPDWAWDGTYSFDPRD